MGLRIILCVYGYDALVCTLLFHSHFSSSQFDFCQSVHILFYQVGMPSPSPKNLSLSLANVDIVRARTQLEASAEPHWVPLWLGFGFTTKCMCVWGDCNMFWIADTFTTSCHLFIFCASKLSSQLFQHFFSGGKGQPFFSNHYEGKRGFSQVEQKTGFDKITWISQWCVCEWQTVQMLINRRPSVVIHYCFLFSDNNSWLGGFIKMIDWLAVWQTNNVSMEIILKFITWHF
jgi:hypothetical protein